jgi:hypothetical protein
MHKLNLYLLVGLVVVGSATYAQQDKRYPIGSSNNVLNSFRKQIAAKQKPNGLSSLQLQLSPSLSLPAAINYRRSLSSGSEQLAGTIENVPNSSFYLLFEGKSVSGHILLHNTKKAYKYSSDESGAVFVEETDINNVVCIDYKQATSEVTDAPTDPAVANAAAAVTDLQSFPGGNGCVLLDFDGQLVSGTGWNNGNPINAAPANLTDADKEKVWQLISEDYRPFHINITTSEAVFNTYPKTRRMRCIFTPTNTAAPGAGGVAYVGSFKTNDDTPCWVFNSGARAAGEAGSHEVGHTLGLSHDGRTSPVEEYYQGQGGWAPIMGVGYYVSLVQWSKGEYANASQKQDDLSIITSTAYGLGYRTDDYGNTTAAAAPLTVSSTGSVSNAGLIERTGDADMFAFTTTGGNLNLTFTSNAAYPDLDILATLYDKNGTVVTTSNPTGLNASISSTLAAGNYYVSVTGTGSGDPVTNGYSNYGSLGTYTITGTVIGGSNPPPTTNKLPVVTITSPVNGNTFTAPANITINANATDSDGTIAKVEFFNGSTKLGEDATSPYSFAWSNVAAGTYSVKAVATDDRGGQATTQITVSVGNTPGVTIYKDCNYGGYAITLPIGSYTLNQLMAKGALNDDISSMKVNSGYEAILYRDNNFAGPAYLFRGNASCLVSVGLSGGSTVNLNDWTSSVVIRQTTARATMAAAAATDVDVVPFIDYSPTLQLLPNPVDNEMIIRYGNMGDHFDVSIVNINGGVVYSAPRMLSGQSINVVNLRPGIYFVKINTGKETITRKLIKR